jgi:hypothetical protein
MKKLLKITILTLALTTLNARASLSIKSIELTDTTIINGPEISAINIFDETSIIESVETNDGLIIPGQFIKSIHVSKPHNSGMQTASRTGGEGSGG